MARRAAINSQSEPEHDAWSEAWGDRALQNLGRWLMANGLDGEQAMLVVEQTWLFYSYIALPELRKRFPLGIAAKPRANRPAVYLYLTFSSQQGALGPDLGTDSFQVVQNIFATDFAEPLSDIVEVYLEPFQTRESWFAYRALQDPVAFEDMLMSYAAIHGLIDIGVFVDDLAAELRTVMAPESVPLWLETPNSLFIGRKPVEFLDDPLDRQLRDVITRAKFNIPAA